MARKSSSIGGQAVIEGVLMKNDSRIAIAVRRPDKKISVKKERMVPWAKKCRILGWPVIRGTVNLIEMMVIGIRALNYSANEALGEDEQISGTESALTMIIAIALAVGLFVVLPLYLAKCTVTKADLINIIDGIVRLVIFFLYLWGISFMKDVRRLFQYHGAEHMSVHCLEHGEKLTVQNVRKYGTAHRRCGTTFLFFVLLVSIIIFSFIVSESFWVKLLGRIVLIPVVAGLSYELLKLGARFPNSTFISILVWPGMMLQRMTTRRPDKKQIEVAIKALEAVSGK
ncbi:DUF1385 domain-containing protein [Candidatus Woesearchaeota archaeon]|nr:DUF1385 domain-containing protein [Candidatus Woesearchaeota archaeon]